jgi:mRNA interferase RelE/StbE
MKLGFTEKFYKDLDNLNDKKIKERIVKVIDECKRANLPSEIRNLKKLEGYDGFYRIRVGDFRIGIEIKAGVICFYRVANRKDIYKIFP